jgi:hypothetical protein
MYAVRALMKAAAAKREPARTVLQRMAAHLLRHAPAAPNARTIDAWRKLDPATRTELFEGRAEYAREERAVSEL